MTFSEWRTKFINESDETLQELGFIPAARESIIGHFTEGIDTARAWSAYGEAPHSDVVNTVLSKHSIPEILEQNELSEGVLLSLLCASGLVDINDYIIPEVE